MIVPRANAMRALLSFLLSSKSAKDRARAQFVRACVCVRVCLLLFSSFFVEREKKKKKIYEAKRQKTFE